MNLNGPIDRRCGQSSEDLVHCLIGLLVLSGRDMKHIVLSCNLLVMGLTLLRLQANSLGEFNVRPDAVIVFYKYPIF